jgi:hypothetical protein
LYKAKEVWGNRVWMEGGFMIGLPYETRASWRETVDWLKRVDCPLDISTCYPLNIVKKTERNQWFPTSWFDNNYEEFGYTFPYEGVEGMLAWQKDDDTDIPSFMIAQEISDETLIELRPFQRERRGDFYASSFNHPVLKDREATLDMTPEQYSKLMQSINFDELFYKTVIDDYFYPLLQKLKTKK